MQNICRPPTGVFQALVVTNREVANGGDLVCERNRAAESTTYWRPQLHDLFCIDDEFSWVCLMILAPDNDRREDKTQSEVLLCGTLTDAPTIDRDRHWQVTDGDSDRNSGHAGGPG